MKKLKKLTAIVLSMMMILSLGATAFAAGKSDATIEYYVDGEYYFSEEVDSGISVMAALKASDQVEADFGPEFTDINGNPAYVLNSMMGAGSEPGDGPTSGVAAEAWSTVNPGYGLMSTVTGADGAITAYNYVYVGYDWVYSVKDAAGNAVDVSDKYMNQYIIQSGDTIVLEYNPQEVYWTTAEPWMSAYPYI